MAFGSERIWHALKVGDDGLDSLRISEKVVRRLMREEGLFVIYDKKKRARSSCKGEIGDHSGNRVNRHFHVDGSNRLWLAGITQFASPRFRCCLSAIIDCFDGSVVLHRLSEIPDADLANSTLIRAVGSIEGLEHPILRSGCGCRYRWPEWIELCEEHGIVRSMSRKARSPDNAACEGFFGRLKNGFFYYRDWADVSFEAFSRMLDEYIDHYNKRRKKRSLGWMSPRDYRLSSGYAA